MAKNKLQKEQEVVTTMIDLYCRGMKHPRSGKLRCDDCEALHQYARKRINACPFGEEKSFCSYCTVHCYRPVEREKIRQVMRYAGPRMIIHHPVMAIAHLLARWQSSPKRK